MIVITDKSNCCGCSACAQKCPKHSITMTRDEEGFLYFLVNKDTCIDCGLCEQVCPLKNKNSNIPKSVWVAFNSNPEILNHSSSGGIFHWSAEKTISQNGVVFGAAYDGFLNVIHKEARNRKDLFLLMGSKYVQSNIDESFQRTKKYAFIKFI